MEKQILIKVTPEFKKLLKMQAYEQDISVKDLIIKAVNQYVMLNDNKVKE